MIIDERIYYQTDGHRMRLIDYRANGNAIFEDLDEPGSRVQCHPNAMSLYPPPTQPEPQVLIYVF